MKQTQFNRTRPKVRKEGIIKRSIAGVLALAMVLTGGAFGAIKPAAASYGNYGWNLYSYASCSNFSKENGAISLAWDSSTVFTSGDCLNIYPAGGDGVVLYPKMASNDIFSKSGYECRGAALSSDYQTPYSAVFKYYENAKTALDSNSSAGATYLLQPVMLKIYNYDFNYPGAETKKVTNNISFNGTTSYILDTSPNKAMFSSIPQREGYTFDGWYTSAGGGAKVSSYSTANQDTLYAHWNKNSYNVSLLHGNGISSVSGDGNHAYGDNVIVSAAVKDGYHFTGWSGTYSSTDSSFSFTMPAKAVTLTANAAPNIHKLSFVVDGQVVSSCDSVPYGSKVSNYAPEISDKTGYTFSGWLDMPESMPDHDLSVTGSYNANSYTITFISDGTSVKSTSIKYGESISSVAPSISKQGYTFDGWFTAESGGDEVSVSETYQKTGDMTLYAHWTPLYHYDPSNSTFYIYSQDSSVISEWKRDATILGAKKIVLGNNISELDDIPLAQFSNLEEIAVDSNNVLYTAEDGLLYSQDKKNLIFCPAMHADNPLISEECETVKKEAFRAVSTVNKIILPFSVQKVEEDAFNTSSIKNISVKAIDITFEDNAINASTELKVFKGSAGESYAEANHINFTLYTVIGESFFEGTKMTSFNVPDNITAIEDEAFRSCSCLTQISIPNSVKSIGNYAFAGDDLIEGLDLSGVETIGENAFAGCSVLADVILSENIKKLEEGAFRGCVSLSKLLIDNMLCEIAQDNNTIPQTVTIQCYAGSTAEQYAVNNRNPIVLMLGYTKDSVIDYTRGNSTDLVTALMIGSQLQTIGENAFEGADNLKKISFEEDSSLKKIGISAFEGTGLTEIILPSSVESLNVRAFAECAGVQRVDMSKSSVREIPEEAFAGCLLLSEVLLPDSVLAINKDAFIGCTAMENVQVENQNCVIFDSENTFPSQAIITGYTNSTANVYAERYKRDFVSLGNAYIVSFDTQGGTNGTEKIYVVNGKKMPEIVIPKKEGWQFGGYFSSIDGGGTCYYNESGVSMNDWDITDGKTLYAYWMPESHTVIFHAAGGISEESRKLKIGEAYGTLPVATREGYIFLGWYTELEGGVPVSEDDIMGDKDITLYAHWSEKLSENSIPAGFLKGNEEIRELTIPSGVVTICRNAFRGCSKLEKVNLPDTLTTIEEGAFAEDALLSKISLANVKKLGDNAFEGTAIDSLILEKGCVYLGKEIFKDAALTDVVIKSDISEIPQGIFSGCEKLESVTIDSTASVVGESAFERSGLKVITLPRSIEEIGKRAFAGCAYLEKVVIEDKDCKIFDSADTFTGGAVVSGCRASTARDYAEKYDYDFEECGVSYIVSFNADGGSDQEASWYAYENDTLKETVSVPERKGYAFLGYYVEDVQMYDANGNLTDASYAVQSDLLMVAKWEDVKDSSASQDQVKLEDVKGSSASQDPVIVLPAPKAKNLLPAKGTIKTIGNLKYKVTKSASKNGTVSVVGVKSKKVTKATVPATVRINGFSFKATAVGAKAFKGCKKLKSATIGKNIKKIGSKAFYQDKKLKRLTIKSKKLKKIGVKAFTGISKKAVVRAYQSKIKSYKKMLRKRQDAKKIKIGCI